MVTGFIIQATAILQNWEDEIRDAFLECMLMDTLTQVQLLGPAQEWRGVLYGVIAKVLACSLSINKFKLKLHYYIHFQTNALWKGINPFILSAMG